VTNTLSAREAAYYRVVIASNTPSWKVKLSPTSGEALLLVQKDALPNVVSGGSALPSSPWPLIGGKKMQKAGDEHYVLLPSDGQTNLLAGTYYLAVVSEGINPHDSRIGTGSSDYVLASQGSLPVNDLGTVTVGNDLVVSNRVEGGESAAYQFSVPPNTASIEVQLEDRVGNPAVALVSGTGLPRPPDGAVYGQDGGYTFGGQSDYNLITVPNPGNLYSLVVQATYPYPDATY